MFVQVKDSSVPKRECSLTVSSNGDDVLIVLQDMHVENIGLTLFTTRAEAEKIVTDLLPFCCEVLRG